MVRFLSDEELFPDGENWFGPELRGEVSGHNVHPVLTFAKNAEDPAQERSVYLALDLTRVADSSTGWLVSLENHNPHDPVSPRSSG